MISRRGFTKLIGSWSLAGRMGKSPWFSANLTTAAKDPPPTKRWYHYKWKGMETANEYANPDDPVSISRFFGDDLVRKAVLANLDYMIVRAKHGEGYLYYNTRHGEKHKNLGRRDFLREACDAGKRHGILILASYQIQYDNYVYEHHPDWRMKDWQGRDISTRICFNAKGYLDLVKQHAEEIMNYAIVGFHFDMLDFGFGPPYGCFCVEHCQPLFRQRYQMEMPRPAKPTWDEDWDKILEFRCSSNERFANELREFVHSRRPELSVDFNYHGYPPFYWQVGETPVRHNVISDYGSVESLPWAFGHFMPSLTPVFLAGANPAEKHNVTTSRFIRNYTDLTIRPVSEMKWEVYTILSHGAFVSIVDFSNYDGTLDVETYRRIGEVFGETGKKEEYFGHQPVSAVGLYYSLRSRDWYAREDTKRYMPAFRGAYKILVESHIAVGIVFDENVTPGRLREYPVMYLPNVAILSDKEIALLREYVVNGGKLLATGHCGDFDWMGNPRKDFLSAEFLGVRLAERIKDPDAFFRLPAELQISDGNFMARDIPVGCDLLTLGDALVVQPVTAKAYGELRTGTRLPQGKGGKKPYFRPISPDRTAASAVFIHRLGKGEVIYVPFQPDAAYVEDFRMPEHRLLVRNLVEQLYSNPPFRIDAPLNVEAVVTHDEERRRYIIHLIGLNTLRTNMLANERPRVLPPLMEEALLYRAKVEANVPFNAARVLGPKTSLKRNGRVLELTTEEIHEAVVLNY